MRILFKKALLILIVILLFSLALLGAILPIIPGFVFFFAGIIVLSWIIPSMRKLLHQLLHRFPRVEKHILRAEEKLKKWFRHS
ncbi:hypothetical protein [Caedibacter taeniospiralis]|uniref:hypothetical protein n=1 Tax=Caedibacter taeniospiralis TaxID=28907 RepID=UPI0013029BEF|nr:hypothetical protein [Caedibacter taeniospiralis]